MRDIIIYNITRISIVTTIDIVVYVISKYEWFTLVFCSFKTTICTILIFLLIVNLCNFRSTIKIREIINIWCSYIIHIVLFINSNIRQVYVFSI